MKRYGVLLALLLLTPSLAWAAEVRCGPSSDQIDTQQTGIAPMVVMQIFVGSSQEGETVDVSDCFLNIEKLLFLEAQIVDDDFTASITATMNPDPFISFGTTTTNLIAGPVTYAFLFGTPIVPGIYNTAASTAGVTVSTVSGTASVDNSAIAPFYVTGYGTDGGTMVDLGVAIGTAPCSSTTPPIPASTTCDQGTGTNTFPPTFFDNLEALLTYEQTGLFGVASWSGVVTLEATAVPEPASITLLGMGALLLAIGGAVRWKR
jgi:hypothetical protein